MSEKTKEKQLLSSENDKKDKDIDILKAFQILKDIPLSKISFLVILYTLAFFIIPYFVYYRFLPIDSSLISVPLKFILLGIFGFFIILFFFLFFILGVNMFILASKDIYGIYNKIILFDDKEQKKFNVSLIIKDYAIYLLSFFLMVGSIFILIWSHHQKTNFLIKIAIAGSYLVIILAFLLPIIRKIGFPINRFKLKKYLKLYNAQYISFIISIIGILIISLILILDLDSYNKTFVDLISNVFMLFLICLIIFLLSLLHVVEKKYIYVNPILISILIPLIILSYFWESYIYILKVSYSLVGVASHPKNPATFLCISQNSNVSVSPGIYEKRLSGEPPLILINSKKRFEDYICFRDINVVWNGDNYVWITEDEKSKFLIKIPKTALLNHEVMFLPKSDTNSNTNYNERKNEKDKNKK